MPGTQFSYLSFLPVVAALAACIRMEPCPCWNDRGPFIDSVGYRAAQLRTASIAAGNADELISQALRSQETMKSGDTQPDVFQSIEDSYQRYRQIFFLHKKGPAFEVRCDNDLLETFRLELFDPQPFMNAILHTFPMQEITTLDFDSRPHTPDTLLVSVSWAKAASPRGDKSFAVTEGALNLYVAKHSVSLASPLPEELLPTDKKENR